MQSFELENGMSSSPLLAAVGPLQFEVVQYRLENEYGAECRFEPLPYIAARWYRARDGSPAKPTTPTSVALARDSEGGRVALFQDSWSLNNFTERNPDFEISDVPLR
jgi:peptide chain release factor 3